MVPQTRIRIEMTADYGSMLSSLPNCQSYEKMAKSGVMKHATKVQDSHNGMGVRGCNPSKRRVRFSDTLLNSYEDYTNKELGNCWYSKDEKDLMRKTRLKMVARLEADKPVSRHDETYRGLEALTREGTKRIDKAIAKCINVVMDEQDRQFAIGIDNSDRMAALSQNVTRESINVALKVAKQDEIEAQRIWNNNPDNTNQFSTMMKLFWYGSCNSNMGTYQGWGMEENQIRIGIS